MFFKILSYKQSFFQKSLIKPKFFKFCNSFYLKIIDHCIRAIFIEIISKHLKKSKRILKKRSFTDNNTQTIQNGKWNNFKTSIQKCMNIWVAKEDKITSKQNHFLENKWLKRSRWRLDFMKKIKTKKWNFQKTIWKI